MIRAEEMAVSAVGGGAFVDPSGAQGASFEGAGAGSSDDFVGAGRNAVGDHATDEDSLGFAPYVQAIAAFLRSDATEPPLTISIEGEWGSGKSSFLLQLEKAIVGPSRRAVFLEELPTALGGYTEGASLWKAIGLAWGQRQPPAIRFNAWRHDKQDALWAAFALAVAAKLRRRIGFLRAWRGDLSLLVQRLQTVRGWLELLLFVVSILLFLGSAGLVGYHVWHLHHEGAFEYFTKLSSGEKGAKLDDLYVNLFTKSAAARGSVGGLFLLGIAGFLKFQGQIKLPIATDLKKYLSKPDYEGRSSFIESFHEDFARLVQAYAGNERIYIFIDDLDRCDVPRAAELMQAINLMIADAGRLVFILGMDREKVAAGITQKYKDLLPFLPEYSSGLSPGLLTGAGSSPLSFGYSYLEKFIQLSFTLPVLAGPAALDKFLDAMLPRAAAPTWRGQIDHYWTPRLQRYPWSQVIFGKQPEVRTATASSPPPAGPSFAVGPSIAGPGGAEAIRTEAKVRKLRMKIAEDSKGVRSIVSMVAPIFDNNPRRLKQFVSTFRLALALTSGQDILALDSARSGVTPQQLGKFIALTMRYPDLRVALAEEADLLGKLELTSRSWPVDTKPEHEYWRWLRRKGVRQVLLYGVRDVVSVANDGSKEESNPFSLADLDVTRLLSLLPWVAAPDVPVVRTATDPGSVDPPPVSDTSPPASSDDVPPSSSDTSSGGEVPTLNEAQRGFDETAASYETMRTNMRAGAARTRSMTDLMTRVQDNIKEFAPRSAEAILAAQLNKNTDGNRVVALAIACERNSAQNMDWLLQYLMEFRSNFEHYWTIRALLLHERFIDPASAGRILDILQGMMEEISKDSGRVYEAQQLLDVARSKIVSEPASSSFAES